MKLLLKLLLLFPFLKSTLMLLHNYNWTEIKNLKKRDLLKYMLK